MSQANVEVIRALYHALAESNVERVLASIDPAVEVGRSRRMLDPDILHGYDGLRDLAQQLRDVWSNQRIEPEEYIAVGESVVVPISVVSTGRKSGITIAARAAWVWEFRDGLAVRATVYQSKGEALEAVGLQG